MKQRVIAILCLLAVMIGIMAMTTTAKEETASFRVGYSKKDITPWVDPDDWTKGVRPIPLSGYGESYARLAKGWLDDNGDGVADDKDGLFTTCIAVTDENDKTMLFISYDAINAEDAHVKSVRTSIVEALDGAVGMDDIMINASHSHYSPDYYANISLVEESMQEAAQDALDYWKQRVIDQMTAAAVEAMANRKTASSVTKSETDASDVMGMEINGVRHYIIKARNPNNYNQTVSWYAGDNFGTMTDHNKTVTYGPYKGWKIIDVKHVSESNDNLYLLQFSFADGSDPIVLANWRGHTTLNRYGTVLRKNPGVTGDINGFDCIGSDYVNAFRYEMEKKGYQVSFIQGASGNINNKSRASENISRDWSTIWEAGNLKINGESISNTQNKGGALGKILTVIAMEGLKSANMETCEVGAIRNMQARFGVEPHTFGEDLEGLVAACEAYRADPVASAGKGTFPYTYLHTDGKYYTLNSRFHVNTIEARAKSIGESVGMLELNAIMLGPNLAFVTGPGELYDYYDANGSTKAADNDWLTLITEQYGTPFVMGYSNGSHSYIPNTLAYSYNNAKRDKFGVGSYGSNISQVTAGSGEAMIAEFAEMLQIINDPTTLKTYYCEHCEKVVDWEPLISSNNGDIYWYTGHYYLKENIGGEYSRTKNIASGNSVCLDLNGHSFETDHRTYGRAFVLERGSTLSVMDTAGGGEIIGKGHIATSNASAGTIFVYAANDTLPAAEFNLYGGTISRNVEDGFTASYGGTVYCGGKFNLYGGTVNGGRSLVNGGTVHMTKDSTFTMYGGTINEGVAEKSYNGLDCYRGVVKIYGGTVNGAANFDTAAEISGCVVIDKVRVNPTYPLKIGTLTSGSRIGIESAQGYTGKFITDANGGTTENAQYFVSAAEGVYVSGTPKGIFVGDRWGCECGGTKPAGHTCENVAWAPWSSTTTFPTATGNYYLTNNITTSAETYMGIKSLVRVDLNGKNVTYKIPASKYPDYTRVLSLYEESELRITDSTANPGTISRDTSLLTPEQISSVPNWGLLALINGQRTVDGVTVKVPATLIIYNGIFDGSDSRTTGGGIVSAHNAESTLKMYGGTIKGGTTRYGSAVLIHKGAVAEFYGGNVVSGTATDGYGQCVLAADGVERLAISGNANIQELNILGSNTANSLTVKGTYTGTVALKFASVASGKVIGNSENANIDGANITCVNDSTMEIQVDGTELKLVGQAVAVIGDKNYGTVQAAIDAYSSGVITLQADSTETITIPAGKTVTLDLNGFDLKNVTATGTLYLKDSKTDDYTVADGDYGMITGKITGNVKAVPVTDGIGYLMATETRGVSFHKIVMTFKNMVLRPSAVGMYYQCNFLGDERVKDNVAQYGVALSVAGTPSLENGEFTEDCQYSWFTTFNAGSTGNGGSSTLLKGIMKETNGYLTNKKNSTMDVYSRTYFKLKDGTYLLGEDVAFSLKDLMETANIDSVWSRYDDDTIAEMVKMYQIYTAYLKDWDIENLKAAVEAAEKAEEDSVLKILALGNSHTNDSTQMLYEVFRANSDQKVVIGRMYYSGCTLTQHMNFSKNNEPVYTYYKNENGTWVANENTTMLTALKDEKWDVVILQEGSTKIDSATSYDVTGLEYMIQYVKDHAVVEPQISWNMTWTHPTGEYYVGYDPATNKATGKGHPTDPAGWYNRYNTKFNLDQEYMYEVVTECTKKFIVTDERDFELFIPSGTVIQYAKFVLGLEEQELYRDYTHLNDYGRLMISYLWYAKLMGLDNISDLTILDEIPEALRNSKSEYPANHKITQEMKDNIVAAVNYALQNPWTVE